MASKGQRRPNMKYAGNDPRGGSGDKGNAKKDKVEADDLTWVFPSRIAALEKFEGVTLPPALLGPTLLSLGAAPVIRKGAPTPKLPTITYLFPPNGLRVTLFYDPTKPIDIDSYNDDECTVCGVGGELVMCDGCPASFHPACHPHGDLCPSCVAWMKLRDDVVAGRIDLEGMSDRDSSSWNEHCGVCGRDGELVLCAFCPKAAHIKCSNFRPKNDEEDWVCADCSTLVEIGASPFLFVIPEERLDINCLSWSGALTLSEPLPPVPEPRLRNFPISLRELSDDGMGEKIKATSFSREFLALLWRGVTSEISDRSVTVVLYHHVDGEVYNATVTTMSPSRPLEYKEIKNLEILRDYVSRVLPFTNSSTLVFVDFPESFNYDSGKSTIEHRRSADLSAAGFKAVLKRRGRRETFSSAFVGDDNTCTVCLNEIDNSDILRCVGEGGQCTHVVHSSCANLPPPNPLATKPSPYLCHWCTKTGMDYHQDFCWVCKDGGSLRCCDHCYRTVCNTCEGLGSKVTFVTWYCGYCSD
ncbi:hypothetical protein TrVE_jg11285 [Triparma verrucosa]|uniref:PHD-type domain-containing protein n=1 Tax=Triparma verrucosa TaxID=1606542 RepID=A0A9W7FJA4_9STRA|nr:hypothetical protein TrVE_jg11285 [Triparma verrucosa]